MFYKIPGNLPSELEELDSYIERYLRGEIDAATLKARRVPFGCYEQRVDGTYMVRIRTTGGALTPRQLRAIAEISARHECSSFHITTRREFQIHDVALEDVFPVMRELLLVGLASRGGGGNTVRNVLVSPDAGVGLDEVFDPSPCAFALASRLIAEPDSWLLPRKFKIAFSNSPADKSYAASNDLGFLEKLRGREKGFRVYVAGGLGAKPEVGHLLHEWVPAQDVYVVTTAVKRLFDKDGNRKNRHAARLRFLWNSLGEEQFSQVYEEQFDLVRGERPDALVVEDVPQSSATPHFAPAQDRSPEFTQWKQRYVERQRQPELLSISVPAFLGNLKNEDAIRLAEFLEPFGNYVVRAAFGQNLRLRNIPERYLPNVFHLVREISSLASGPRLLGNSISCTGADTCKLGICLSKGALTATVKRLGDSDIDLNQIPDFRLNLSGCPNTCGQHILADLGFYGNVGRKEQQMFPAYMVVAGAEIGAGKARLARPIDRVSARDLPEFVHEVLKLWLVRKNDYPSFAAYIDGDGAQESRTVAGRFRDVPTYTENKSYYFDWGATEPFSLAGKGVGECSAGLFDFIEVDLKGARQLREELRAGQARYDDALYGISLRSARSLLITRGIETPTDKAAFENFRKHFIQSGLIDQNFGAVIAGGGEACRCTQPSRGRSLRIVECGRNALPRHGQLVALRNGCVKQETGRMRFVFFYLFLLALVPEILAAQHEIPDHLRQLLQNAPPLAVDRIELTVDPTVKLEGISALTADQQGNIYVIHRPSSGDPIVVLDRQGRLIRSWGGGMFKIPHGIRIDPEGNVWTVDAQTSKVYKFTPEGKKLLEIDVGGIPDKSREFCGATDVALARSGHVFVTDGYCNARVIEYDADGIKVREWGKHGSGPGEFNLVHSIAIGPQGNLYIADRENGRVQWFDQTGRYLGEWDYGGQLHSLAFSQTGAFYAVLHPRDAAPDRESYVVQIDLATGKILGKQETRSHELSVAPDGALLPATRDSHIALFQPRK